MVLGFGFVAAIAMALQLSDARVSGAPHFLVSKQVMVVLVRVQVVSPLYVNHP